MAQKKKTTKTKKLHPGGSVPGFRPMPRQLTPAQQRIERRSKRNALSIANEQAQSIGYKNAKQLRAALARMTPEQRDAFTKKNQQSFADLQKKRRSEFETKNAKLIEKARRQGLRQANRRRLREQNPMMPTAGISQGRPIRGRTPMPGPAPDAARMQRFQKLMAEQQKRYNERMKNNPNMRTVPIKDMIDPKSLPTLDDAMRAKLRQQIRDAARFPSSNRRKKPARNQLLVNKVRNRRKNKPRTTGLPDAKYS